MPFLWILAFGMSYPQMHWKEMVTRSLNEHVAIESSIPITDWIGKILEMSRTLQVIKQEDICL